MIKKFFLFLTFFLSVFIGAEAQTYYERAQNNLPYLLNHPSLYKQVKIDSLGITIYADLQDRMAYKAEMRLLWGEVPKFLYIIDQYPLETAKSLYLDKGIGTFPDSIPSSPVSPAPLAPTLKGLKVALDPGHLAGNRREAKLEHRYMEIDSRAYGGKKRVRFYEADLAYNTALILKKELEAEGAEVLITRGEGESAMGMRFKTWYRKCFKHAIAYDLENGQITQERYDWLKNEATKVDVFWRYFKRKDFEARAAKINAWQPDLTLIIHYNAHGSGKLKAHNENFSMAFVGGSFVEFELSRVEYRMEFLRLLLSEDLKNSIDLSRRFIASHEDMLGIPPVPEENPLRYLNNSSVFTGYPGVYCRNLFMSRTVHGTTCFGESLMQENFIEADKLSEKDYREGSIKTSSRVKEVADAYLKAVKAYVNQTELTQE